MTESAGNTQQLESCPFCRSNLNSGATVCAYCGAFKGSKTISAATQAFWFIFVFLPVLSGFLSGAMTMQKEILGGIGILLLTIAWFVLGTKWVVGKSEPTWLRRN